MRESPAPGSAALQGSVCCTQLEEFSDDSQSPRMTYFTQSASPPGGAARLDRTLHSVLFGVFLPTAKNVSTVEVQRALPPLKMRMPQRSPAASPWGPAEDLTPFDSMLLWELSINNQLNMLCLQVCSALCLWNCCLIAFWVKFLITSPSQTD